MPLRVEEHTIVGFHQIVIASSIFIVVIIIDQRGACADLSPRVTRVTRHDHVVFFI